MKAVPEHERQTFTVVRGGRHRASPVLMNLIRDTSTPVLEYLAEKFGLRRVPGLSRADLTGRLLRQLSEDELKTLETDLIAARFGARPVEELLEMLLRSDEQRLGRNRPRLDDMPADEATLLRGDTRRWVYTMHGHDVIVDMANRHFACSCPYFRFASHRQALCKHLSRALTLMPEAYARDILIELLLSRQYGAPDARWTYQSMRAA